MKDILINISMFAAGAAIGSVVTWKIVKTKYEQIAQEEIDSVKQVYSTKHYGEALVEGLEAGLKNVEPIESIEEETAAIKEECETIIEKMGYVSYSSVSKEDTTEEGGLDPVDKPYVISPEEFDEIGYTTISLIYFEDKVLTDDMFEIVDDIEYTVGRDSLNHFGEYEDDSVHVRNDALKCDYEILRDQRRFADLLEGE